jgi:hypothetical protein
MVPINWSLSDADIRSELLTTVETRLPEVQAWATGARGVGEFGPGDDGWDGMVQAIRDLGWNETANQLTTGYDYGDPRMQQMLVQLGIIRPLVFTPDRIAALQAWGVRREPRWVIEGFQTQPTLEQVASRKLLEAAKVQWAAVKGVVDDRLHSGMLSTWDDVVAVVTGVN